MEKREGAAVLVAMFEFSILELSVEEDKPGEESRRRHLSKSHPDERLLPLRLGWCGTRE